MALHYNGGGMNMAAIGFANPRNEWSEANDEANPTGKKALGTAAAGLLKGGRNLARKTSRLGRNTVPDGGNPRPASRLSSLMGRMHVGDWKQSSEFGRQSKEWFRDAKGAESEQDATPTKKRTSSIKKAFSFRKNHRNHDRKTSNMTWSAMMNEQDDDSESTASTVEAEGEDGYSLCRVPALPVFAERVSSRVAPRLPLLSFPSVMAMPLQALSVAASFSSTDRDEYSGGEEDEGEARVARMVSPRLITVGGK